MRSPFWFFMTVIEYLWHMKINMFHLPLPQSLFSLDCDIPISTYLSEFYLLEQHDRCYILNTNLQHCRCSFNAGYFIWYVVFRLVSSYPLVFLLLYFAFIEPIFLFIKSDIICTFDLSIWKGNMGLWHLV